MSGLMKPRGMDKCSILLSFVFSDLFSNTSESVKAKDLKYILLSVNRYQKSKRESLPNLIY